MCQSEWLTCKCCRSFSCIRLDRLYTCKEKGNREVREGRKGEGGREGGRGKKEGGRGKKKGGRGRGKERDDEGLITTQT